jgi:hypothetical protein
MDNYKTKYLKYKNKYLQLKNQYGGIHNGKTSTEILTKLVEDRKLEEFPVIFDELTFAKLSEFFTTIKNNRQYSYIPEVYNEHNYVGKRVMTKADLDNYWISLEKPPTVGKIISLDPNIFAIRDRASSLQFFNDFVTYDSSLTTDFLQVSIGSRNIDLTLRRKPSVYENILAIFKRIQTRTKIQDVQQMSNYAEQDTYIYLDSDIDISVLESRLDNMFDGNEPGTKQIQDPVSSSNKLIYYNTYGVLANIHIKDPTNDDDSNKFNLVQALKTGDKYEINPIQYANIMLNDYYNSSVQILFETIVKTLNDNIATRTMPLSLYMTIPDAFFHIHVCDILDENKVMLVLHAKYEIESDSTIVNYKYKDDVGILHDSIRYKPMSSLSKEEVVELRKVHSFYLLFDMGTNTQKIYSTNNDSMEVTDGEDKSLWNSSQSIALNTASFGKNIADLNYISGKKVILTTAKLPCGVFCPA